MDIHFSFVFAVLSSHSICNLESLKDKNAGSGVDMSHMFYVLDNLCQQH